MNISSIKNRADELLIHCKPQVIRIMTIMWECQENCVSSFNKSNIY